MSTTSTSPRFPDLRFRAVLIAAVGGALLGAISVLVAYAARPTLTLEMDRSLPRRIVSGLYDAERSGDTTFAWTSQRTDIKLADLNRRVAWSCSVRFRGGRSDPATQPSIELADNGIVATSMRATNDFQDATIVLPSRSSSGAVVTISSSRTLVPGPSDPRQLGVQIDRITCAPEGGLAWPPFATVRDGALAGAIFGAAFALVGLTLASALGGVMLLAVLQALPLSAGPAPYIPFSQTMLWFAIWIAIALVALVAMLDRSRPIALQHSARLAMALSAAVLYVKLLGLLHPSKQLVDAVFHAHRFEWVLAGKYYFTQGMPGGVTFPYAIGLYVFAAPWTVFTQDHVTLLRVIVCSAQAVAGALLYPVVIKAWNDRIAAVSAVVLFNVVPLPYGLLGNANLTNTFGEAAALAAVASASLLPATGVLPLVVFFLLATLAFLSHVSTFALLAVTLAALAVLYRVFSEAPLRRLAVFIGGATVIAAILAIALYWGHFADVYTNALRVRANTAASQVQSEPSSSADAARRETVGLTGRIANAVAFGLTVIGWPVVALALVGAWRSAVDGVRDRASLAVLAWCAAGAVFLGVAVMRVDAPFQRYAAEFFGRVLLATFPAAVILAARATSWAWTHGLPVRLASVALAAWAVILGIQNWMAWFV
jgi:hypothetical protein